MLKKNKRKVKMHNFGKMENRLYTPAWRSSVPSPGAVQPAGAVHRGDTGRELLVE